MTDERFYTFTIKASMDIFKGNKDLLDQNFRLFLSIVGGTSKSVVYEDLGTRNVHIHALITCPYIKDKSRVAKMLRGWSIHSDIIKCTELHLVKYIWFNYTHKLIRGVSDSDRIHECFGNMFL